MIAVVRRSVRSVSSSPTASHVMPFTRATCDPVEFLEKSPKQTDPAFQYEERPFRFERRTTRP